MPINIKTTTIKFKDPSTNTYKPVDVFGQAMTFDAEAYGTGKRNGTNVTSSDVAYNNNAKYYSQQAEAYGIGKRNGTNVGSNDVAYHNNAKYYSQRSEAYSIGTINGTNVGSGDTAYHNNAKYYAEQIATVAANMRVTVDNNHGLVFRF